MPDKALVEITRGEGAVVVALREFKGRRYLDLRFHYRDEAEALRPTKNGVTFPLEVSVLSEVEAAIRTARRASGKGAGSPSPSSSPAPRSPSPPPSSSGREPLDDEAAF